MKKPILILLIFTCAIGIAMVFSWPEFQAFQSLSAETQQKQQELVDLGEYISHLQSISEQINQNSVELEKIDQALMTDDYMPNFFSFIQQTAQNNGIKLTSLEMGKVSTIKESKNVMAREVNVKISGPYGSLKNFLIALEKNARIIDLSNMALTTNYGQSAGGVKIVKDVVPTLELNLKIYSYQK